MSIGSLFSGIGGLELGLEAAGLGPTLWQVECDPFCRQILARHWPDAVRYDDVKTVGGDLAQVDIICGGFPCQDISVAGKGAGLAGTRSGLWFEYARIVRELRPRFVVIENVPALLGRGLDVVLGDLAACGYDAIWFPLSAQRVGAPHRRERLFVVAYADGMRKPQPEGREQGQRGRAGDGGSKVADADGERLEERSEQSAREERATVERGGSQVREISMAVAESNRREENVPGGTTYEGEGYRSGSIESGVGRDSHGASDGMDRCSAWPSGYGELQFPGEPPRTAEGVPARTARLKALGNAVVPQCAEVVGWVVRGLMSQSEPDRT